MKGVIMAAGKGTRMEPFSSVFPKPLLPVCNVPLIERQIMAMKAVGIEDILIVVGHLGFEISRRVGDGGRLGVKINYVEQKQNLGIAHAVGMLEPHIDCNFLLFLGDIYFVSDNLGTMFEVMRHNDCSAVLAVKGEDDPEAIKRNFSVILRDDGFVKRVIEKPRHIPNRLKGCGIYLFSPYIFDAIRRTPRTAMRNEYEITESIQKLIDDGFPVQASEVITLDINLTFPHDLLECNLTELGRRDKGRCVGENASINGARVVDSIIGDNVVIERSITIEKSMVFPEVVVDSKKDLSRMIITAEGLIDCGHYI